MNPESSNPTTGLLRQWHWHLTHASRAYWIAQAGFLLFYLMLSLTLFLNVMPSGENSGLDPFHIAVRLLFESLLLLTFTHLIIRPALRIWFVNRQPGWGKLLSGFAALLLLGYLYIAASYTVGRLTPDDGFNIEQINFQTTSSEYGMQMSKRALVLIGGFNQFTIFTLWSFFYLAWKAFEGRRQLQRQIREARLRQLTHQLSPHFLFNAFNTIRGMIFEDRERAAELVTQLSELFRFHLSSDMRTEQTLAEDWELARRYLDLEVVRLESRLTLDVDIAPELMHSKLPSLTLLTLVENAIKHGIAPNREGGWLRIRATPATSPFESGWSLEVGNSRGRGQAEHSTGHGLANLRERLTLTHGERTTLQLDAADDRFLVRMVFPA